MRVQCEIVAGKYKGKGRGRGSWQLAVFQEETVGAQNLAPYSGSWQQAGKKGRGKGKGRGSWQLAVIALIIIICQSKMSPPPQTPILFAGRYRCRAD
jgi:hypothetical protein